MKRGDFVLSSAILAIASLAGCGGGGDNPDALLVPVIDASPPDSSPPDAFVCTMDECPGDVCTNFDTDPEHCGDCDTICQSGATCESGGCVCPAYDFIPATLMGNPFGQDMVIDQLPGTLIAITPYLEAEIDIFGVGYPATDPMLGVPYTLDGTTLPTPPFAIAAYDIDINTMMPRAAFAAVDGTLTYTTACAVGASGTLTNATFQAAQIFPSPMIDPNGCTFEVTSVAFSIGEPCPPTPP